MTEFRIDDFSSRLKKRKSNASGESTAGLLPDPETRPKLFPFISADDHIVEPPHLFDGRLPARLAQSDRAPRLVEDDDGTQVWHYDGKTYPIGQGAVAGKRFEDYNVEPARFDHMRRGCWDPVARVADMDVNGVDASLNFPNMLPGFAGQRFSAASDPELGLALVRAWNDWLFEEWVSPHPGRFIPCQLTWLNDPRLAAAEVVRNAERGFTAVSFVEAPHKLGLPSLHTGHWDPFVAACEETETVICLHAGSSSTVHMTAPDAPAEIAPMMFPVNAMFATVDWLYSRIPVRFANVKIVPSEGGIGWVPGLVDRMNQVVKHRPYLDRTSWDPSGDLTAVDVMRRNFWFCAIDDPSGFVVYESIGVENIIVESDYPHADTTWPDTQAVLAEQFQHLSSDQVRAITYDNAAALFRHDPQSAQQGHDRKEA